MIIAWKQSEIYIARYDSKCSPGEDRIVVHLLPIPVEEALQLMS